MDNSTRNNKGEGWKAGGAAGAGAAAGAGVSAVLGGMGLSVAGTAVAVGAAPLIAAGALVGLAGYGVYRLLPDTSEPLTPEDIERKIANINQDAQPGSPYYGKLMNWKRDGRWQYGIGLSPSMIFSTGSGLQTFRFDFDPQLVGGVDDLLFNPSQTIERLVHALRVFGRWKYTSFGWNCEHLARLVATDDSVSYEVRKAVWPIPSMNHNGYHPTAKTLFAEHLQANAPHLLKRNK